MNSRVKVKTFITKITLGTICVLSWLPADVQAGRVIFVDQNADAFIRDGFSWCTAFLELGPALDLAANAGGEISEIRVAQGVYTPPPTILPDARDATVQLINGVALIGGYAGCSGAIPDQRDFSRFETTISGDRNRDDDLQALSENSFHVVTGDGTDATAIIDGFTITAGFAHGDSRFSSRTGDRNIGAGMVNDGGSPTVRNCIFQGNDADIGGGMKNRNSSVTVINSIFRDNVAAFLNGGGFGGGMDNENSTPTIINCTFVRNTSGGTGGGMCVLGSDVNIYNSIFWDNADSGPQDETAQIEVSFGSTVNVLHSCIQDIAPNDALIAFGGSANNNIDDDPLFVTLPDDLHLTTDSPCRDTGNQKLLSADILTDLDGHARVLCDDVDMGAYEFGVGDQNCDAVVNLFDFASWPVCMNGPDFGVIPMTCQAFDYATDRDVDLLDYAAFQLAITAAN